MYTVQGSFLSPLFSKEVKTIFFRGIQPCIGTESPPPPGMLKKYLATPWTVPVYAPALYSCLNFNDFNNFYLHQIKTTILKFSLETFPTPSTKRAQGIYLNYKMNIQELLQVIFKKTKNLLPKKSNQNMRDILQYLPSIAQKRQKSQSSLSV